MTARTSPYRALQDASASVALYAGMLFVLSLKISRQARRAEQLHARHGAQIDELDAELDALAVRLDGPPVATHRLTPADVETIADELGADVGRIVAARGSSYVVPGLVRGPGGRVEPGPELRGLATDELARLVADDHARRVDEAFQPDPATLEDCSGCATPAGCQAEQHCRAQLPEPTRTPEGA
jgi:hypothetical protein